MEKTTRKVGTLTLGVSLITFGIAFICKLFISAMSYEILFKLWPIILIMLGIETIMSYVKNDPEKLKYDGISILLIVLLSVFSMGMACCDVILTYMSSYIG